MTEDAAWVLTYDGFEPEKESLREALCTLGNGYFCTRGAGPETRADEVHYPGTYAAGLYNRLPTEIAGREIVNEDLVNLPNWLCLQVRFHDDEEWFALSRVELLEYRQELDLKRGLLARSIRCRDPQGRETRLDYQQFVHMRHRHLAAVQLSLVPENWAGRIRIRSALDGRVENTGVARYRSLSSKHLEPIDTAVDAESGILLRVRTRQSRVEIVQCARTRVYIDDSECAAAWHPIEEPGYVAEELDCEVEAGQRLRVEKTVALCTSRDRGISESSLAARKQLARAAGFGRMLAEHTQAWDGLWRRCDIKLVPDSHPQLVLRLHVFHMLQTASPNTIDLDAGVPARGLHGEAYRGHIFWDELFVLPWMTLRLPDVTRSFLLYRYRRLDEARWNAREAGYRGAMFPWQSASDGREETQEIHLNPKSGRWIADRSRLQRHVNAAIAYNVWFYVQATQDRDFLSFYGAEMIFEIARFWASLAHFNPEFDRYEIRGVMGPDEYHDGYPGSEQAGLANNAYTNVMVAWVCWRALDTLDLLDEVRRRALCDRLGITDEEIETWDAMSRKMRLVVGDDGVISQFEGYEELEELDWDAYREKYGNIQRLDRILEAEGDDPNRYKLSKQADVLMLLYLFSVSELRRLLERLGYPLDEAAVRRNVAYYMPRTSEGSTLSRIVHAWLLARIDRDQSWDVFREALESDISDVQGGTTAEGIHLGAMGGTVDIIQRCYTGLEARDDALFFHPNLPAHMHSVSQRFRYRGHWLDVRVHHDELEIEAAEGPAAPIKIGFDGEVHEVAGGGTLRLKMDAKATPRAE